MGKGKFAQTKNYFAQAKIYFDGGKLNKAYRQIKWSGGKLPSSANNSITGWMQISQEQQ
jgi:hypothetical protein